MSEAATEVTGKDAERVARQPWFSPIAKVEDRKGRRRLWVEMGIVLSIFPGSAILAALAGLLNTQSGVPERGNFSLLVPGQVGASALISSGLVLFEELAPVALALYLLFSSGVSWRQIGISKDRLGPDLLVAGLLFVLIGGATALVSHPSAGAIQTIYGNTKVPFAFLPYFLLRSVLAGVCEETILLGYLISRLQQVGVPAWGGFLIGLVIRASYHIEYGAGITGLIWFGVWMGGSYVATRRLLPMVLAHSAYDVVVYMTVYSFW